MLRILILCGLSFFSHNIYSMQGVDTQILTTVEKVRNEVRYDPLQVPSGFDEKACGYIISYDSSQRCAITHIGDVHYCDFNNRWSCVHKVNPNQTPETFAQSYFPQGISHEIYINHLHSFVYNPSTHIFAYLGNQFHKNRFGGIPGSLFVRDNLSNLVIEQEGDVFSMPIGHHNNLAISDDGTCCACSRQYDHSLMILKKGPHAWNPASYKKYRLNKQEASNIDVKDLCFLSDNSVEIKTLSQDDAWLWRFNYEGRLSKQSCVVDCGEHIYASLYEANKYPLLYKKLIQGGNIITIKDPRFRVGMLALNGDLLWLPKELQHKILHHWYECDETLKESEVVVYGHNDVSFSKDDRDTFNTLRAVDQYGADSVVEYGFYDKDRLFTIAEQGKKWKAYSSKLASGKLLKSLMIACSIVQPRVIDTHQGIVVIDRDGAIVLKEAGTNHTIQIQRKFKDDYWSQHNWSYANAQQFMSSRLVQRITNASGKISLLMSDQSEITLKNEYHKHSRRYHWERYPENIGANIYDYPLPEGVRPEDMPIDYVNPVLNGLNWIVSLARPHSGDAASTHL